MFGDLVVNLAARINQFTRPMQQAREVSGATARSLIGDQKAVTRAVEVSQKAQMQAMKDAAAYAEQKAAHQAQLAQRVNAMNAGRGAFTTHSGVMANQSADASAATKAAGIAARLRLHEIRKSEMAAAALRNNPLPKVAGVVEQSLARIGAALGRARQVIGQGVSGVMSAISPMFGMGPAMAAFAVTFAASTAAMAGVGWGTKQLLEAEKTQTAFAVMLDSGDRAKSMLSELRQYGRETGYGVGAQRAAETMLAFGVAADRVAPNIKAIGDIARGDQGRLEMLSLAFSQSSAAGRLMGQDLLQMVNAGFNPLQEISRKTGESLVELKKRMEEGNVPFAEVQAAFISATSAGGKFHDMMDKIKMTAGGQLAVLLANVGELVKEVTAELLTGFDLEGALANLNLWLKVAREGLADWRPTLHAIGSLARFVFERIAGGVQVVVGLFGVMRNTLTSVLGLFMKLEKVKPPSAEVAKEVAKIIPTAPALPKPPKPPEPTAEERAKAAAEARRLSPDSFLADPFAMPTQSELEKSVKRLKATIGEPSADLFVDESKPFNAEESNNRAIERNKMQAKADKVNEEFAAATRASEKARREKIVAEAKPAKLSGALQAGSREAYSAIVSAMAASRGGNLQQKQLAATQESAKSVKTAADKLVLIERMARENPIGVVANLDD